MFGNSGTRPFREVAAEAETPRRSGSGPTQDHSQALPAKFAPLEPLATALGEVQTASGKSAALVEMVVQLEEVRLGLHPSCILYISLDLCITLLLSHATHHAASAIACFANSLAVSAELLLC